MINFGALINAKIVLKNINFGNCQRLISITCGNSYPICSNVTWEFIRFWLFDIDWESPNFLTSCTCPYPNNCFSSFHLILVWYYNFNFNNFIENISSWHSEFGLPKSICNPTFKLKICVLFGINCIFGTVTFFLVSCRRFLKSNLSSVLPLQRIKKSSYNTSLCPSIPIDMIIMYIKQHSNRCSFDSTFLCFRVMNHIHLQVKPLTTDGMFWPAMEMKFFSIELTGSFKQVISGVRSKHVFSCLIQLHHRSIAHPSHFSINLPCVIFYCVIFTHWNYFISKVRWVFSNEIYWWLEISTTCFPFTGPVISMIFIIPFSVFNFIFKL